MKNYKSFSKNHHEHSKKSARPEKRTTKPSANKNETLVKGKLIGNQKGYAFLVQENSPDDVFIPASALNGAIHGDEVYALARTHEGKTEGRVIKIVSHTLKTVVGQIQVFKGFAFVVPDNKKISKDVFVKKDKIKNAVYGDKVVVSLTKYDGKNLEGEVTEVLGPNNENPITDVLSIVRSYDLIEEFPAEVEESAQKVSSMPIGEIVKKRVDYRNTTCITIDGDDSKDFDDAVSLEMQDGNYILGVHIADVGEYVKQNSVLDKEAFQRGTSVYFPNLVLPMLPESISNGSCSLVEGEDRLTLSCVMTINKDGKVIDHKISESVIRSRNRMTYNKVTAILQGDETLCKEYAHLVPMLQNMQQLCLILEKIRKEHGSLDFDIPEPKIIVDPKTYELIDIIKRPRTISERMIEAFMVLANETVAEHFQKLKIPFVYRIHEKPDADKLRNFNDFVAVLGLSLKEVDVKPKDVAEFLKKVENSPMKDVVNKVLLRAMQKAKYSPDCLGHFGLASTYYCHFTSPIRRYPDLTIHRIIKEYLRNQIDDKEMKRLQKFVVQSANQSSTTEVSAQQAERDVDDYFKARFMKDKIGTEYEGIISGVMNFGLFIELDNTVEGFVPVESLEGTNYTYSQKLLRLSNGNKTYKLGDKVRVKVAGVNLADRRVNFVIVQA